jgi:hypothetical protein
MRSCQQFLEANAGSSDAGLDSVTYWVHHVCKSYGILETGMLTRKYFNGCSSTFQFSTSIAGSVDFQAIKFHKDDRQYEEY